MKQKCNICVTNAALKKSINRLEKRYGSNLLHDEGQLPADRSLNVISGNESLYNQQAFDLPIWPFDCVLIRLNKPIPFSDTVYPVKLPSADQEWLYNRKARILG
ncbi:uncharacterized protein LOC143192049 [Rhynchophorus ferrugineus]|uniref:uncharacterized protein LOC143192049 n=1 Tax=Rhynchophorus ferrugineus TaxID=354439 RepID=UPI003FCE3ED8